MTNSVPPFWGAIRFVSASPQLAWESMEPLSWSPIRRIEGRDGEALGGLRLILVP
jgi:hypothetical protein